MDKKIVFFDIDGTIYSYDKGMPEDTFYAIQKLKQNGHIPVICTGRTKCMIYPSHMAPGFDYIVAGAGTYVEVAGKEIYYSRLGHSQIEELSDILNRNGFVEIGEGKDYLYLGTGSKELTGELKKIRDVYQKEMGDKIKVFGDKNMEISKVSGFMCPDANVKGAIRDGIKNYQMVNHKNCLLEFIPKGEGKAGGMKRMIQFLEISKENVYAFGDSLNDKEMLEFANVSIVMGNGDNEMKKIADYVTDPFDQGGIYNALKKFRLI
ncbi:MAG: Cof-type HAD-IIB family hydrolase [Eubacterium sp.]|nr:Cof-type HAD-IIB family hydrolase [Eubacterium sp.]